VPCDSRCQVPNRPVSVYRFPRQALTLCCPQFCMGIQPGARFSARSADALSATLYGHTTWRPLSRAVDALSAALYGHFTQAIYRNRPIALDDVANNIRQALGCGVRRCGRAAAPPRYHCRNHRARAAAAARSAVPGRGLHSPTSYINLSRFGQ